MAAVQAGTGASTNGYATGYSYDHVGNLTTVDYPAGTTDVTLAYDALNRLTNMVDAAGTTKYSYAMLGSGRRTANEDGPWTYDEVTVSNRYGLRSGLKITQPTSQFVVTNAWDASRRWKTVGGTAGTFTYSYPANSASPLPNKLLLPSNGYITNVYDSVARLTRTDLRNASHAVLDTYGYQYNQAGQRTFLGRTNSALTAWNSYVNLRYDAAGQLTNAWTYLPDGTPVTTEKWAYGYDAAQNLAKRTNNVTVETFTVNALNQLTAIPDSTPTYDRRGNLITRAFAGSQTWSYSYDAESQLVSVSTDTTYTPEASRWKVEFVHDGQGRLRIKRDYIWSGGTWSANGETRYLYEAMLIVQERDSANTPQVTYTRGRDLSGSLAGAGGIGGLLARSHGYSGGTWSTHNFYHADGNGNITALVNASHAHQASYKYDPYGRLVASSGTLASANVMRFSSKPWVSFAGSATSGLYYYGFRFYEPYLNRWPNRDPIEESGGINLFSFVGNNPLSGVDLWGLDGKGKDLPPGFKYFPPGSAESGNGDWIPGSDLSDCLAATDERYLKRQKRDLQDELPRACIPGWHPVLEAVHFMEFMHLTDRAAESSLVRSLDKWACYMKWDPQRMPPYLKQLLDDLSRKYDKASPKK